MAAIDISTKKTESDVKLDKKIVLVATETTEKNF